jgi:hypothetical protein
MDLIYGTSWVFKAGAPEKDVARKSRGKFSEQFGLGAVVSSWPRALSRQILWQKIHTDHDLRDSLFHRMRFGFRDPVEIFKWINHHIRWWEVTYRRRQLAGWSHTVVRPSLIPTCTFWWPHPESWHSNEICETDWLKQPLVWVTQSQSHFLRSNFDKIFGLCFWTVLSFVDGRKPFMLRWFKGNGNSNWRGIDRFEETQICCSCLKSCCDIYRWIMNGRQRPSLRRLI